MSQQQTKKQTAKKQQPRSAGKQQAANAASQPAGGDDEVIFNITYQGRTYRIGRKDLTDREARLFRREHGVRMSDCLEQPDLDVFVTLVWLMDLRDNPTLTRDSYDGTMDYDDLIAQQRQAE